MNAPLPRLRPGASGALALLFALVFTAFAPQPAAARADKDWKPIDPSELGAATAVVEKDADAEALFWEVYIDDSLSYELSLKNYVRIKVFNERGRDSQSKVELPYYGNNQIKDIAARVVKPDGTVVELKKEDVFDRTVVKVSGVKVKVKSFALPGVEPGSVIEYRWREVRPYTAPTGCAYSSSATSPSVPSPTTSAPSWACATAPSTWATRASRRTRTASRN